MTACQHSTEGDSHSLETIDSLQNHIAILDSTLEDFVNGRSEGEGDPVELARSEVRYLKSEFVPQTYQLKISFPKSYFKTPNKKYPVLYVLDAETNFGGVSYIVQRLIKDGLIPEILVVGIAYDTDYKNFYRLRSRDLTPVELPNLSIGGNPVDPTGGAPAFSKFLEEELFPFVEDEYRIQPNDRALYGHSYGGLFGAYTFIENPDLFNRYLLLGPSLWFNDNYLLEEVMNQPDTMTTPTNLYMGSGEHEGRIDDLQVEFVKTVKNRNLSNLKVTSEVAPNETHRTIFGIGFTNGLRFIYE
ncbi:MAG: alpha/beta hydrolase-fold protein [Schleiferiaceae bacterium]